MKKTRTILAALCALALLCCISAAAANETQIETARFTANDMHVNYLYAGAAKEDAVAVFGNPAGSSTDVSEATGDASEYWYYNGMVLIFDDLGELSGAEVTGASYMGPRGLQVGMSADEATALFYIDPEADDDVLYSAGYIDAFGLQIPPSGSIYRYDDGIAMCIYYAPQEPYTQELLEDPMDYVYEVTAQLYITLNADAVVTSFSWTLGALAE